jgi:hypothetical protein
MDVIKLSPHASVAEQTTLEERRQRLDNKIRSFHSKFEAMAEGSEHEELLLQAPQDEGHAPDDEEVTNMSQRTSPELMPIFMPSSLKHDDLQRLQLEPMAKQEMELRKGQANDALEGLRLALGHKALLYRSKVRGPPPDL